MIEKQKLSAGKERQGQSLLEECFASLGEAHHESVYEAIERLVKAGEQVGFTVLDLIRMLNGGMSVESLLDVIEVRMADTYLHAESTGCDYPGGVYAHGSVYQ